MATLKNGFNDKQQGIHLWFVDDRPLHIKRFFSTLIGQVSNFSLLDIIKEISFPKIEFEQGNYFESPMPDFEGLSPGWLISETGVAFNLQRESGRADKRNGTDALTLVCHNFWFRYRYEKFSPDKSTEGFNRIKAQIGNLGEEKLAEEVIQSGPDLILTHADHLGLPTIVICDLVWDPEKEGENFDDYPGVRFLKALAEKDRQFGQTIRFALSSYLVERSAKASTLAKGGIAIAIDKDREGSQSLLKIDDWNVLLELGLVRVVGEHARRREDLRPEDKNRIMIRFKEVYEHELEEGLGELVITSSLYGLLNAVLEIRNTELKVLILGETGAGKEYIARLLHCLNDERRWNRFVAVNCASIPKDLLESELFGYEKGAFTGATKPKEGLLELANGGTIFLDEIADMTPETQAKILRTIEFGEITRLGGKQPIPTNVRVIAATHKDLNEEIAAGRFRDDLRYRLEGIVLTVPPLRERPEDITLFARGIIFNLSKKYGKSTKNLSDKSIEFLQSRIWRGNVRELRNVIERAFFLIKHETIEPEDIIKVIEQHGLPSSTARIGIMDAKLLIKEGDTHGLADFLGAIAERWIDLMAQDEIRTKFDDFTMTAFLDRLNEAWSNGKITDDDVRRIRDSQADSNENLRRNVTMRLATHYDKIKEAELKRVIKYRPKKA
jgi:DNA-binding NtrC family response regulator